MHIIAHNHAGGVIASIAAQMTGLHRIANQTNMALGRMRIGVAGAFAGYAGSHIVKDMGHIVDHASHFVKIQNQMTAAGWSQHDVASATARAWELSAKYQGMTAEQVLEMQKEMAPVLGDKPHAIELAGTMSKLYVAMQGTLGAAGAKSFNGQIQAAIKASELSGNVLDPARFELYLDGMAKTLKAFGGTITPRDYMLATKYGRSASMNWGEEFTNTILPTIMQELGSSSTGTALMTMYSKLIGGQMKPAALNQFDKFGLIDKSRLAPDNITPEGKMKHFQPGSIKNADVFLKNPYEWVQGTLIPALLEKGVMTPEGLAEVKLGHIKDGKGEKAMRAMFQEIAIFFGDRTAQGITNMFAAQERKILRDQKLINGAMNMTEGADFYNEKDYSSAMAGFHSQWSNLTTALGMPGVASATVGLHMINNALSEFTKGLVANPRAVMVGLASIAGIGALAVVLAPFVVAFAALGVFGLSAGASAAVLGVTALAAGLTVFAALNWKSIQDASDWMVGRDESNVNGGMKSKQDSIFSVKGALGALSGLDQWVGQAFHTVGNLIKTGVSNLFSGGGVGIAIMIKNSLKEMFSGMSDDVRSTVIRMREGIVLSFKSGILSIPGRLLGAITTMASNIGKMLYDAIASIGRSIGGALGFGGGSGGVEKQSFTPPAGGGGKTIQVHNTINMDGHRVATQVAYHIEKGTQHVHGGAAFDGTRGLTPIDMAA